MNPALPSKSLDTLALSTELAQLGAFLDRVECRASAGSVLAAQAPLFQTAAKRARGIIDLNLNLPSAREACLRSPALFSLLECALFDRAAARGRLQLGIDWSRYGR